MPSRRREGSGGSVPATFLGPDVRAPRLGPFCTHIPSLCDPGPRPLEKCPGQGAGGRGQRARFCRSTHRVGGGGGGRGRERPREGAGEGSGARPRGRGAAADAEERDARGGRRLRAAAGRGALEARPTRGQSRELHEVPPGPRTGRCPGEAVGGSPTSMARRGPRRRARSKSGSGASAEGRGPEFGRGNSRPDPGWRSGLSVSVGGASRRPVELPAPRSSAPWLFWKLANVFVERDGGGEGGSDRNGARGCWKN